MEPGYYKVSTTWLAYTYRATDAPFTIYDGDTIVGQRDITQKVAPNDFNEGGTPWEEITTVTITGTTLTVKLTNDANSFVVADAIRIEKTLTAPTPPPAPTTQIIDNGDSGHTSNGFINSSAGYKSDQSYTAAGNGSNVSTWTFSVAPGTYRVSTTWLAYAYRATDAPFTIYDGDTIVGQRDINQKVAPNDFNDDGTAWEDIATVTITGTTLTVKLTNDANSFVVADAIRIEETEPIPPVQIIDNGDGGHTSNGYQASSGGYNTDHSYSPAGNGSNVSTWTFSVVPGTYKLSATWLAYAYRATDAPFTIYDGDVIVGQKDINQKVAPNSFNEEGTAWENIATVTITGTTLTVKLTNDANSFVAADAIRIEKTEEIPPVQIVDNGDTAHTANGYIVAAGGYNTDHSYAGAGSGSSVSTWTFAVTPGRYKVSTTWVEYANRATNAPFTIYDGTTVVGQANVNQKLAPDDLTDAGKSWENIATVDISGSILKVT
ncbi:MAG: hypothetical protein WAO83_17960, partial [Fuerstiella sp.]